MADTSVLPAKETHHEGYRVRVGPEPQRIRAVVNGETVAESSDVLVMHETRLPPVFYFPRGDVNMSYMEPTSLKTHCPFKGNATYWSLKVGDRLVPDAAWSYEEPFDESAMVRQYVAFYWDAIDSWYADELQLSERPGHSGDAAPNPFIDWLIEDAWQPKSVPELLARLSTTLQKNAFPVSRVRLLIQTLNPQLFAMSYTWHRDVEGIEEYQATHAGLQTSQFLDSPFAAILRGEGGIRRRLEGPNPKLDFPILHDLLAEGATDYVAVPMRFSDGQINILVLVSDRAGGFTTEQLGQLYEILANLSRLLEAHAQRVSSLSLLQTYLGRNAGRRVIDGLVKRGDGEELRAVIWFSDLRGSTSMAERLSREEYLSALNDYFDSVAGAVIEHGGEVLKFIGDAVLAIFAIEEDDGAECAACERALAAVQDAEKRIAHANGTRSAQDQPTLRFGTALHIGALTYGNIGTPRRLDFTVIGPAVNEASRIEALCKSLGKSVLISEAFAASSPEAGLTSLGRHSLRDVKDEQELFTLS
ncbi:MAG: DUF427 domain-containing protein [Hyphomicrobiaceae bacterium]